MKRSVIAYPVVFLLITCTAESVWADRPVEIGVSDGTGGSVILEYVFSEFVSAEVDINGLMYADISLGSESRMMRKGYPALPDVSRSIVIDDTARMKVNVLAGDYYEISDIDIAPSKGNILRTVDPATVPYTFGVVYRQDKFYPDKKTQIGTPYIMRDVRGAVVTVNPFQYNPVQRVLRVYTSMKVEVSKAGKDSINVVKDKKAKKSRSFETIYKDHFINYSDDTRYAPVKEEGDMLIIYYDEWLGNIQPFIDHKNMIGISTTAIPISSIGNDQDLIKAYIQNVYDTSDLAFVLLVGDAEQVAPATTKKGEATDPVYSLLAGNDSYPDIVVGRFSAETAGEVDTQVLRSIEYELMPATMQSWFKKGTGIGSEEGTGDDGEFDWEHIENIRTDLLGYGYTVVDQIYGPDGTAADVTEALNQGRGIINYCGHGWSGGWGTTGFSTTHVNALVNNNMLPFIFSVACVNGEFIGQTCFAEAWLRATNGSEPTGAIGIYAASINQSWSPPMCAQDEFVDRLVAQSYYSFGGLCFAASCQMMDEYGTYGVEMFETWHIFGDPSVRVFGTVGIDEEPPTPNPMGWTQVPYPTGDASIKMQAATASDPSGVEYYFTCVSGGGHDSGWQSSSVYEDTGLVPGTEYGYTVKARDNSPYLNETFESEAKSAFTNPADMDSPTPDPMTWEIEPAVSGATTVTMTASAATDASGIEYYFACVSGGGNDSGWQESASYTDTDLALGERYSYTVKARDKSAAQNETEESEASSAVTEVSCEATAISDIFSEGTVDGDYADTHDSDNVYESFTELESSGVPIKDHYSYLEHKWQFDVVGGDVVTFNIEAYHTANSEGDDFVFAYSTDDAAYTDMVTVTKTSDDDSVQSFEMPADIAGAVYVRVLDIDRSVGNSSLDTVYIDRMYIESVNLYDGRKGMVDFEMFAGQWGRTECGICGGADLDGNGDVTIDDFAIFAGNWMGGS